MEERPLGLAVLFREHMALPVTTGERSSGSPSHLVKMTGRAAAAARPRPGKSDPELGGARRPAHPQRAGRAASPLTQSPFPLLGSEIPQN